MVANAFGQEDASSWLSVKTNPVPVEMWVLKQEQISHTIMHKQDQNYIDLTINEFQFCVQIQYPLLHSLRGENKRTNQKNVPPQNWTLIRNT